MGQYVDEFSKLARYAPDDVATDAAKQEKFLEGLNDELSIQLMVATFKNYQELVDKATILEGKQQQIDSRKQKYGQGKYNSGGHAMPHTREDTRITTMEDITMEDTTMEGMGTVATTVATTSSLAMEAMATSTVPLWLRRI